MRWLPAPRRPRFTSNPAPTHTVPRSSAPSSAATSAVAVALDEQADAIVYLASEHATFINGAVVPVDDGWAAV